MPSVDLPLSLNGVRGLVANLKQLAKELRDDIPVDIERSTCEVMAEQVRENIPTDPRNLDGNYAGASPSSVTVEVALQGHETVWRGDQIAFLEFGTGAAGALNAYPGDAMARAGYHPDPTKAWWVYNDELFGSVLSRGLAPHAPMFSAAVVGRSLVRDEARQVVNEALNRAVALR